ncbi:SNA3 (YJL151C) [Zygosaccharomyces parabailii]|uniref:BN860_01794g1_1 n=1 Tax=Zygosaccharomyces bailii (strain CLIB 213 / ATCC 58445 / CBS 680 / BCRC 21525 / NBRC 1098 / NCYC 1416 / NRRL Y-2227) TaxID=1333698 RepID=A0A8J2T455_ZYGB2|nr:SNA3 (YJL151C) [Zygosaccharomyces parabailii]CDF87233.1 BN860_01794g1_1 [Zygosaccharomyces bailii CLIB 213]CDH15699.1 related to Protein SNA3 [Zygosaccharomyces bailii ISA1307]SJM88239.1 related to protein SNA3 [Zygosaccharomyces bailii]
MSVYSVNKNDVVLMLLGVFIPPIPVLIRRGFFSRDFLLNLLLFLLFFFPAIIHAGYVIYETSEERQTGYESVPNQEAQESSSMSRRNGDFNVDLEAQSMLPRYEEVVEPTKTNAPTDNKVQI